MTDNKRIVMKNNSDSAWKDILVKKPQAERKHIKFALTKRLYNKGYNKGEISNIYKFIDWFICLPKPLEIEYINDVNQLEEMSKMAYVTSMERYGKIVFRNQGREEGRLEGREEGRLEGRKEGRLEGQQESLQKGRQEEKKEIAKRMLKEGFDLKMIAKITKLSIEQLEDLTNEDVHQS